MEGYQKMVVNDMEWKDEFSKLYLSKDISALNLKRELRKNGITLISVLEQLD